VRTVRRIPAFLLSCAHGVCRAHFDLSSKEDMMATMNAPTMERRHLPERRVAAREGSAAMSALDYIAMALLIIGGLNWAAVGLFDVDIVATLFGAGSPATRLIYVLIGISALYSIYTAAKMGRQRH
jgi:uncharacterized membrane protein YuzA (DUF378 family)